MEFKISSAVRSLVLLVCCTVALISTTANSQNTYNEAVRPNRFTALQNWAKEHHHDNQQITRHIVSGEFTVANLSKSLMAAGSPAVRAISEECQRDVQATLTSDALIPCEYIVKCGHNARFIIQCFIIEEIEPFKNN